MKDGVPFVRLDELDFEEFLRTALPALETLDRIRALELLSTKLDRALRATDEEVRGRYPGSSSVWCRDLDRADPADGVLAQLARAVAGVAVRASTDPESTVQVFALLERYDTEIFQRIRLRVLAAAGQNVKERLDAFFYSQSSVEPSFKGRETAAVVREQFGNASENSRQAFQRALELGPARDNVQEATEESEREERQRNWQRRRLLWFRDRLPDSLREMAARVGVSGDQPSPRDEALAEDGFYTSSGFLGERSPISVENLSALSPDEFVEFLRTWRAEVSSWTSPTRDGLERILTQYASTQPREAVLRAQRLVGSLPDAGWNVAGYVQALLSGFRASIGTETAADWSSVIGLIRDLLPQIEVAVRNEDKTATQRPWKWVTTEIMDIIIAISRKNLIPPEHIESIWLITEQLLASSSTLETRAEEPFKSFEDVLMAALNTSAGRATEAVLEVALAIYRQALGGPERDATRSQQESARAAVVPRLRPLLQHVLTWRGRAGVSALAVVGTYVPQIHLLDQEWILKVAPVLFDKGASEPLVCPAWGGYITRADLFSDVFADLRNWYERAAKEIPATLAASPERRGQWSLTQHLGKHVFGAYMRGMLELDGPDQLLETTFSQLPGDERAHISWQVFRSWIDAKAPVRPEVVQRLIRFWRWRLDKLIALPESESRATDLEGLTWLICTPHLPDSAILDLGLETVRASRGQAGARGAVWENLARLADVDIEKTFRIAQLLISGTLQRQYGHITLKQTEVVLTRALRSDNVETRESATRLINSLGERGYVEFGRLLKELNNG